MALKRIFHHGYFKENTVNSNSGAKVLIASRKSQGTSGFLFDRYLRFTSRHFVLGHFPFCFFFLWLKLTFALD